MKKDLKIPMNIQFFAEPGTGKGNTDPSGGSQNPSAGGQDPAGNQTAGSQIDYDKIQRMLDGTLAAKETTALKAYFKQQGLSQQEAEEAMETFKQQKAANQPDINAIQQQANTAQIRAQQAMIERDAMMLSEELGIDLKTMPYVLKMADVSQVIVDDGQIDKDKLKEALNKVLEDVPQLKPQPDNSQVGFRQIGVGQQSQQSQTSQTQKQNIPTKRWNRFN